MLKSEVAALRREYHASKAALDDLQARYERTGGEWALEIMRGERELQRRIKIRLAEHGHDIEG